jgi:hypothetical protein
MTDVISHGSARGGLVAMKEALLLWAKCAQGGADYSNLPCLDVGAFVHLRAARAGFEAAVEALTEYWDAERIPKFQKRWRDGARKTLTETAAHLLAACTEAENSNCANAWCEEKTDDLHFYWKGVWTCGREYDVQVNFLDEDPEVFINWDTATGRESNYLHLPSMTDEAETPEGRREGGWDDRGNLD